MARAPKIENDKCENSSVALNLHNHVKLLQTDRRRVGLDGEHARACSGVCRKRRLSPDSGPAVVGRTLD